MVGVLNPPIQKAKRVERNTNMAGSCSGNKRKINNSFFIDVNTNSNTNKLKIIQLTEYII